jgi:RNA polymerase sigma-70 factor (ECF subfamily)
LREEGIVRRILSGDTAAGERLVVEHYARIFRWLFHLTGNRDIAQELTQQTFVRAWERLASLRNELSLKAWLHQIAYHEYTRWLRDKRDHASLEDSDLFTCDHSDQTVDSVRLKQALSKLPPDHRETFLLYNVQGLSVAEVAAALDIPEGTVKSRLFFSRKRLREILNEDAIEMQADEPLYRPCGDGEGCTL